MEPLFTFEHVRVDGRHGPMLVDADGSVPSKGVTVVVGPSGSGKSTLLRLCNRLVTPDAGRVLLRGDDLAGLDPLPLRRRIGMVFQRPTPFPGTVRANLLVAEPELGDRGGMVLERADLDASFLDKPALDLSAGQAQRVCLARTLATDPDVLLMDEPTSSVDPRSTRALEGLARSLAGDGVPVVWVTHDIEQMRRLGDHVLVLCKGAIAYAGEPFDPDDAAAGLLDAH